MTGNKICLDHGLLGVAGLILTRGMCCVLEQETLSSAQYWVNLGHGPTRLKNADWDVKHQHK